MRSVAETGYMILSVFITTGSIIAESIGTNPVSDNTRTTVPIIKAVRSLKYIVTGKKADIIYPNKAHTAIHTSILSFEVFHASLGAIKAPSHIAAISGKIISFEPKASAAAAIAVIIITAMAAQM